MADNKEEKKKEEAKPEASYLEYLMTYGWAILTIAVVLGVLWYLGILSPANNLPVNQLPVCNSITSRFIEFYALECPHCQNMIPVVAQVENETGVSFEQLEVWHNDTNHQVFVSYNDSILRDCPGELGVPTFFSLQTNKSVCGDQTADNLKQFIEQNCYR